MHDTQLPSKDTATVDPCERHELSSRGSIVNDLFIPMVEGRLPGYSRNQAPYSIKDMDVLSECRQKVFFLIRTTEEDERIYTGSSHSLQQVTSLLEIHAANNLYSMKVRPPVSSGI